MGDKGMSGIYTFLTIHSAQHTHTFLHPYMPDLRFANLGIDFFLPTGEVLINTKDMFVRITP